MEGGHDDKLTWPFNRKITITVIDQNRNLKQRQNVTDYLSPSRQQSFYIESSIFSAGRPGVETKGKFIKYDKGGGGGMKILGGGSENF